MLDEKTILLLAKEWNNTTWQEVSSIYVSNDLGESFSQVWTTARIVEHIDIWTPRYQENGSVYVLGSNESNSSLLNITGCRLIFQGHVRE